MTNAARRKYQTGPPVTPLAQRPCWRADAFAKCLPGSGARDRQGCGATLLTKLDWQLHVCDARATRHQAMRGYTDDQVVRM